jgi:hypothetical protein
VIELVGAAWRRSVHTRGDDRKSQPALPQAESETHRDAPGPKRYIEGCRLLIPLSELVGELIAGTHVPETALRSRAAHRDVVRAVTPRSELLAKILAVLLEVPDVIDVDHANIRSHKAHHQKVPLIVGMVASGQHERAAHAEPPGSCGQQTGEVAL